MKIRISLSTLDHDVMKSTFLYAFSIVFVRVTIGSPCSTARMPDAKTPGVAIRTDKAYGV